MLPRKFMERMWFLMREKSEIATDIIGSLRQLAANLQEMADSLEAKESPPVNEPSMPTLEQVRTALAGVSLAGHGAEIKAIIAKYGATKLSDVAPENLAAVLKEAESLGS